MGISLSQLINSEERTKKSVGSCRTYLKGDECLK